METCVKVYQIYKNFEGGKSSTNLLKYNGINWFKMIQMIKKYKYIIDEKKA